MQSFIRKEVRALFPEQDGWQLEPVDTGKTTGKAFRASRYSRGRNQYAYVGVALDRNAVPLQADAIAGLSANHNSSAAYYLLVPQGIDSSGVREEVRVSYMDSFGFADGKLAWLTKKKHAMQFYPDVSESF